MARIVAGRLEAEGVRVRIQGHDTHYHSSAFLMAGTWGILVPAGRANTAREILRENEEGHNVIEDEPDEGLTSSQKATIGFIGVLVLAMGAALALAAAFGR
ncbi:MAG: hypothetical protein AB7J35_06650 [Dehalococcoidia bacterium]